MFSSRTVCSSALSKLGCAARAGAPAPVPAAALPTASFPLPALLRLHTVPVFKLVMLLAIAAVTVRYSAGMCDSAAELWTARFGTDDEKTELVHHYQQQLAERHGWRLWTNEEMRQRFAAHGIPQTMVSDAVVSR